MPVMRTDWKAVADELYAFIVGMAAANARINGKDVNEAIERARRLRDESVKTHTKGSR